MLDSRLRKICLVTSGPSEWLTVALTSTLRELLKEVVKHNIAMNVVGLANKMSILVIAEGAVILSDRRMHELRGHPLLVDQPGNCRYVPDHF